MTEHLTIAIPSKGRLMDDTLALFDRAGYTIGRSGSARGYRGTISGLDNADIMFLPAAEIAQALSNGTVHLGVTGQDLLYEDIPGLDDVLDITLQLGFGRADVVLAVPESWLDVATMSDLDDVSATWYRRHGRRLRAATKYLNITRRFFAGKGVTGYRIVESLGATEGAPASGSAEVIVDITSTGSTLKANRLKILDDGVILKSEAVLAAVRKVADQPRVIALKERLATAL